MRQETVNGRPPAPVAATPLPGGRVTRSRRGAAAATSSAQGSAGSQQFPSPPKTRARGKQNQLISMPSAAPATTRKAATAVLAQSDAAASFNSVQQQDLAVPAQPTSASPMSKVQRVQKASSPVAGVDAKQSVRTSVNEEQQPAVASTAEADGHAFPAQVVSPPETNAQHPLDHLQGSESSLSRPGKRKQSAGETKHETSGKRHQSSVAALDQQGSPDGSRLSSALQRNSTGDASISQEVQPDDQQQLHQQPAVSDTTASSAEVEQHASHKTYASSVPVAVMRLPDEAASDTSDTSSASGGEAYVGVASPSKDRARSSDYQDAHERLGSPMPASPDTLANYEAQDAAEPADTSEATSALPAHASTEQSLPVPACSRQEPDSVAEIMEQNPPAEASSTHALEAVTDNTDALIAVDAVTAEATILANAEHANTSAEDAVVAKQSATQEAVAMPLPIMAPQGRK